MWICGVIWWGLEDQQANQDLKREEVGSGESRKGEQWDEKIYERVRFFEWISWQYLWHRLQYGMWFEIILHLWVVNSK